MNGIEEGMNQSFEDRQNEDAKTIFHQLVQGNQYVGDMYSINYESAKILIHDTYRQKVGGIPSLSFLIATRVEPTAENINFKSEDTSLILLRVMDGAQLPNNSEVERIRVETAQRVSGETDKHWDSREAMDPKTNVYLGYAAVQCRIIGTFFLDQQDSENEESQLILKFGCDISNYYPNRGLKVYKPSGAALEQIVNYIDPFAIKSYKETYGNTSRVKLGRIRYASTDRKHQNIDSVPVSIFPNDLLAQKSAVFGMTRTGKSNTVKIIAKSVYELRYPTDTDDTSLKIGQLILDPNGEYANENQQDIDGVGNPNAIKNIWLQNNELKERANQLKIERSAANSDEERQRIWEEIRELVEEEVVTYGILPHPRDPFRRLMKINFYDEDNLQIGKEIINFSLSDQTSQYFRNFRQVVFERPQQTDFETEAEYNGQVTRFNRRVLVYRALLNKANFAPPSRNVELRSLFNNDLRQAMVGFTDGRSPRKQGLINASGQTLGQNRVSWDSLASAFEGLFTFLSTNDYNTFNQNYINNRDNGEEDATGEGWADSELESLLEMFKYSKGTNLIGKVNSQHENSVNKDYAEDIYNDLVAGKLVIVDQSSGEPEINQSSAERIMWKIFKQNQEAFRSGEPDISNILIYVEEAHNILPSGNDLDLKNVWVRTAKEGAKYNIGLVYSTQEVSSIQKNVLKNTANWFIGHLNNTDETKELTKYYDFADFEKSIRRTQNKGFLRVKTLSNYFVIPVQVKLFDVTDKS